MPINSPALLAELTDLFGHSTADIFVIRAKLPALCPTLSPDGFWLFGTDGCHLCDTLQRQLSIIQKSHAIPVQLIDIIDLDEPLLKTLAHRIPVLITPTAIFNYPFGIMDIVERL